MLGQLALLIAEEPQLRRLLRVTLHHQGAQLLECRRAEESVELVELHHPDVLLLDLRVCERQAVPITRQLRERTEASLVALSDSQEERLKIAVLDAGADDFVTLPFNRGELLARMRATLRRSLRFRNHPPRGSFRVGVLEVNFTAREVKVHGKSIHLTPTEYKLLGVLIASAGKVVTHQRLLYEVWGPASVDQVQYLRVYMKQLRRKLETAPTFPRYLVTEPSVGYRLRLPA
jgi:two-component system, OmpR family, KDP operon response regulator KdpE